MPEAQNKTPESAPTLAERMSELHAQADITLEDLSEGCGVSAYTLRRIENGSEPASVRHQGRNMMLPMP